MKKVIIKEKSKETILLRNLDVTNGVVTEEGNRMYILVQQSFDDVRSWQFVQYTYLPLRNGLASKGTIEHVIEHQMRDDGEVYAFDTFFDAVKYCDKNR